MRGTFRACRPEEIEFSLTVTMPLSEWKELRSQLVEKWPSWQLSQKISDMVYQAERIYFSKDQDAEEQE